MKNNIVQLPLQEKTSWFSYGSTIGAHLMALRGYTFRAAITGMISKLSFDRLMEVREIIELEKSFLERKING